MNWNPFRKKPEPVTLPSNVAIIRYNKHAKGLGILDDENKNIEIYKNKKLAEPPHPYSEELVNSLEEVDKIPVVEESFEEEPFVFEEVSDFGGVEFRR